MAAFLDDALRTADVPGALGRAKVGWGDYLRARREHPSFGLACVEVDQVVRQALWVTLEAQAAGGDPRSIRLLNGGLSALKASLIELGIVVEPARPDRPKRPDRPVVRLGNYQLPQGPCACCARGLEVLHHDPTTGRFRHILVRHKLAASYKLPVHSGYEHWPVVEGRDPTDPRGELAEMPWPVDPLSVLPELTGPTREELLIEGIRLGNFGSKAKAMGSDQEDSSRWVDADGYLPHELPPGVKPAAEHAELYQAGSSPDGQNVTYRLKPEARGIKHPMSPEAHYGG